MQLVCAMLSALAVAGTAGAGTASADPAPQQWLPTAADLVRTLRPCGVAVLAPTAPVCWSMTEDTGAWMAQPPGSPYPWAQCTYYAGLMRPDIFNDRAPPSADPLYDNWDAWTWTEHAQAEGLAVDGAPRPGDVMVYSRAAVGNDVGHVAIVDAVGPADPATGDVEVTVSEMNVDGLDDAALGQGDTISLLLPRSQLVPGMIQFIHRPGPGYVAPAWSGGAGAGYGATVASAPPAVGDPSLAVGLTGNRLETVSESTSPVQATVTALPGGAVVKRLTVTANRIVALGLPGGSYRVCVSQAATGPWPQLDGCTTAAWAGPPGGVTVTLARVARHDRRLLVAIRLRAGAARPVAGASRLRAVVSVAVPSAGPRHAARRASVLRYRVHLHGGAVTVHLPARSMRRAVMVITIPAQTLDGLHIARTRLSRAL